MLPFERAGLASIRGIYAEPVTYVRGDTVLPIRAVPTLSAPAPAFQGAGDTLRQTIFEVAIADLPFEPGRADTIQHDLVQWSVLQATKLDDVAAWSIVVELR